MARDLVDFDKAWAEHQQQAEPETLPDIKMFGETFPRKPSLPAAVTLWAGRLQLAAQQDDDGDGAAIELEDLLDLLKLMVPTDVIDRWLIEQGRSERELRRAFLALYSLYHGVTPQQAEEDAEGEGQAPASSKPPSKAGATSKRTSNASTASTSTG